MKRITKDFLSGTPRSVTFVALDYDAVIDEEIENVVMAQYSKAIELLNNAMPKLHEVAKVLFEKEKISGEEFRSIMEN